MTLGEDAVFAEIHKARPHVACTTPVTAALAAFRALEFKRRLACSPPIRPRSTQAWSDISATVVSTLEPSRLSTGATTATRLVSQSPPIEAAAESLAAAPAIDGIFVSCTSLRVAEAAERLEERTCVAHHLPATTRWRGIVCDLLGSRMRGYGAAGKLYELPSR